MPEYQGPLLPGQDQGAFRQANVERSGGVPSGFATYNPVQPSRGSVLGSQYQQPGGAPAPRPTPGPAPVSNPYDNVRPPQGPSNSEIDSLFSGAMDTYNQAESNLRGQLPSLIQDAEAQAAVSKGLLNNQRVSATEQLGNQELQTRQVQQAQVGQQRQTLQELGQANQQRFGGATSAGQAASELQGREFQRNTFQIGQQAQQALAQIQQQRQTVEREYQQGLQQLEVNKQQAVNEIQRRFQDKLLEINARRGETESAKANMRMQALQELRNAAYQIDVSKAQFQAQLQLQAQQNASYLDNAAQQYLSAANSGQAGVNQFASTQQSAIPSVSTGEQETSPQMMGQINDEEQPGIMGAISNFFTPRREYSYAAGNGGRAY